MAIYVGDASAFEYWFGEQATALSVSSYPEVKSLDDAIATQRDLSARERELERLGFAGRPLHLYVSQARDLRRSSLAIAHVWSGPYPERSFVRLSREVYVEAPLPCLVHQAHRFSRGRLLALCNQFAGTYRQADGSLYRRAPYGTRADIATYVAQVPGMRGAKALRVLLPRMSEGAASPREAALAAFLRLTVRAGGCGLPAFELNHPIVPPDPNLPVRYADCLWALWRIILEYDSDLFHTGAEKIGMDAGRRAQLQQQGYTVVTLTNWQLKQEDELLTVVNLLRGRTRRAPLPVDDAEFMRRHRELKRELFWEDAR